jgi:glycosyltransferase involved in cell wall biosynthesis
MPRLLYATTIGATARAFLRGQLRFMREQGFDVSVLSSPGEDLDACGQDDGVATLALSMEREIRPLADLMSLFHMWRLLRKVRPDVVNAGTSKAGLLGMLAARATGVPVRIYVLHGLRLETTTGWKRTILSWAERLAIRCSHRVLCVSPSLRDAAVEFGLAPPEKATVLGAGTANGLVASDFAPTPERREAARLLRDFHGIPHGAPVIGFVGRIVRDKGIVELLAAFEQVLRRHPTCRLLVLGAFEEGDPIPEEVAARLRRHERVVLAGFVRRPAPYYQAMDLLAFPTHREGFGNVAIEAAASEIPVVAFRVTGVVDSVVDGVTGTLVPRGDVPALAAAMTRYLDDEQLRTRHGQAGRERVERDFQPEAIWQATLELYRELLRDEAVPAPEPQHRLAH